MPRNVEIKAKVKNLDEFLKKAEEVSGSNGEVLLQDDTFFCINNKAGRFKLRDEENKNGKESWLVYYERPDGDGPRLSQYKKCPINNSDELRECLTLALNEKGRVVKKRHLFMVNKTRIHVDIVENLGTFMELEVALDDDETVEYGQQVAHTLMNSLGVTNDDLINVAYTDLL